MLEARERRTEHVEIALDEDNLFGFSDGPFRLVEIVEQLALLEDVALGRVEVFRLAGAEETATESGDTAAEIMNRKEQAIPKPGNDAAVVPPHREPDLDQEVHRKPERVHCLEQLSAGLRKAQAEHGRRL